MCSASVFVSSAVAVSMVPRHGLVCLYCTIGDGALVLAWLSSVMSTLHKNIHNIHCLKCLCLDIDFFFFFVICYFLKK